MSLKRYLGQTLFNSLITIFYTFYTHVQVCAQFLLSPDASHDLLEDGGVDLEVEVVVLRHDLPADPPAQRLLYQERHLLARQVQYGRLLEHKNQYTVSDRRFVQSPFKTEH